VTTCVVAPRSLPTAVGAELRSLEPAVHAIRGLCEGITSGSNTQVGQNHGLRGLCMPALLPQGSPLEATAMTSFPPQGCSVAHLEPARAWMCRCVVRVGVGAHRLTTVAIGRCMAG
jgi:hypothetical protein